MNLERYSVRSYDRKKRFEFISKGQKGRIRKVVLFQKIDNNLYNLAFGDWDRKKRTIDPQVISNNGDRDKVLATVAYSVVQFLNPYVDTVVIFTGETKARTRLYQVGINKHLNENSGSYHVKGYKHGIWEVFRNGKNYESFVLS